MSRWFVVLLLIATLVACPFRCGGAFGVASAAEPTTSADETPTCSCDCCRRSTSRADDPAAPLPADCDCNGCVCEGAVLPEKVKFVAEDAPVALIAATLPPAIAAADAGLSAGVVAAPDPGLPDGRTLRVLHRSLLL